MVCSTSNNIQKSYDIERFRVTVFYVCLVIQLSEKIAINIAPSIQLHHILLGI